MNSYESLRERIRMVRRRWRTQILIKGVSLFLASSISLLVLSVWGADLFGFKPGALWAMRLLTGGAVVFVAVRFLYLPLRRRVSDVQVAQYVEERYPKLEDRLVTAMEFGRGDRISAGMLDLLIKDALDKTNRLDFSVFVNRKRIATHGSLAAGALLVLLVLLSWGPSFFPYGFQKLYIRWSQASSNEPLMVLVTPGNTELAKGTDQQIRAQLVGFDSPEVKLFTQPESATVWTPLPMEPETRGSGFLYLLVDVQSSLRYYVESRGVRSPPFTIKVVDVPKVERIQLTYRFPSYTGMSPETVEDGGDISALKGTRVDFNIHLNQPARSARLLFDNQSTLALAPAGDKAFSGTLDLRRSGSYVVQLVNADARQYPASSEYQIEALEDVPPKVTITKPLRDLRATNVEEVFAEVKAEDDIGVAKVEIRYAVNGGAEKPIRLFDGKSASQPNVLSGHTFFLEEFNLQPGDVISYYGKAIDNNNVTGPGSSSSDIYFIEIRPFEQKYTQTQAAPGPGGGGEAEESLSRQQKEIISATFKLIREKDKMDSKEYADDLKSLALVQGRLQAQAQGLIDRMQRRGALDVSSLFAKLVDYLKAAVVEMEQAALRLGEQKPSEALPPEQKSLQQLMRGESLFREIQISLGTQGSGGSQANAEDLADLFELELNKLKNQYETIQRGEQQARDQHLDEALQRLKELAQRQQQLNERNRMLGQRGSSSASAGGGGQSQQELIEEAERLQRQLQRLSRERSSPELNRVSSQLQQAIQEMKKSLDKSQQGSSQEATAQGIRALQQLEDARRALARSQDAGLNQGLERAAEESKQLLEQQKQIQEALDRLSQEKQHAGTPEFQKRRADLSERKAVQADRLKNLGGQIEDLSKRARKTQRETSSKLSEAAGTIRDKKLPERILQSNQLMEAGYYDFIKAREDFIRGGLEELNKQLEAARNSLGQTGEGKLEERVSKTRQLAEGLESMQQRLRTMQKGQGKQGNTPGQQQASQGGQKGQQQGETPNQSGQRGAQQGQQGQGQQGKQQGNAQGGEGQQTQNQPNPQGGSPNGDVRGLTGNSSGPPIGIGPYGREDSRQLPRELQQRLGDAQELRRLFDRNSTQGQNLDQVIESLRRMEIARDYSDPEEAARLKQSIDLLRQVELDLGRDLARLLQKDKYFYSDDNEAPSSYKRLVEEYYKSLAKGKP